MSLAATSIMNVAAKEYFWGGGGGENEVDSSDNHKLSLVRGQ
jgi:hypothetical protein